MRTATVAVALIAVATVAGLVALWPDGDERAATTQPQAVAAEVVAVSAARCQVPGQRDCRAAQIRITDGAERGRTASLSLGGGGEAPSLDPGDAIRVFRNEVPTAEAPVDPPGAGGGAAAIEPYALAGFERRGALLTLLVLFAVLVIALARWRGLLSLVGLGVSLAIVAGFVVPAILDGGEPLLVALVGGLAVMLVTVTLSHGLGPKSLAALLGTSAALVVTVALALLFSDLANLTGFSSEEASFLAVGEAGVSLSGLLLAGIVIGALGVLDDVTVSQASTVMALRGADPAQSRATLFRRALGVGRDHVAATVNTLVLAYVGASLPVLLIFTAADLPFADRINNEGVAEEVVATLVGSIGLVAAVPITTFLAALLASRLPAGRIAAEPHGHTH